MLVTWIYTDVTFMRWIALNKVYEALIIDAKRFGHRVCSDLYLETATGSTSPRQVVRAILRDFKAGSWPGGTDVELAQRLLWLQHIIKDSQPLRDHVRFATQGSLAKKLLYSSLAAWRSVFCTVDGPLPLSILEVDEVVFKEALRGHSRYIV